MKRWNFKGFSPPWVILIQNRGILCPRKIIAAHGRRNRTGNQFLYCKYVRLYGYKGRHLRPGQRKPRNRVPYDILVVPVTSV